MIKDDEIAGVQNIKCLGNIIDDKLTLSEHIQYSTNEISKSIGIMIKIKPYLDKTTL